MLKGNNKNAFKYIRKSARELVEPLDDQTVESALIDKPIVEKLNKLFAFVLF